MKIHYHSNLSAGCFSIVLAAILFFIIPSQIGLESQSVHGITSRSLPYALSILMGGAGAGLLFQSLVLKQDTVKELEIQKECKGLLYMVCLLLYGIAFSHSFTLSTVFLGIVTLVFTKCKKIRYYLIVVAVVIVLYLIFTQLLHVRLP